jgi:hypothetical protein
MNLQAYLMDEKNNCSDALKQKANILRPNGEKRKSIRYRKALSSGKAL